MWLYHGTYDMYYDGIKKSKVIRYDINKSDSTVKLDELINKIAGRKLRGNCVYLTSDVECVEGFDRSIRISTSWLDTNRLFVADNRYLDLAYFEWMNSRVIGNKYTIAYINSYMTFDEYIKALKTKDKKKLPDGYSAEFLYFGCIPLDRNIRRSHG